MVKIHQGVRVNLTLKVIKVVHKYPHERYWGDIHTYQATVVARQPFTIAKDQLWISALTLLPPNVVT